MDDTSIEPLSPYTLNYWTPDDANNLVHAFVASFSVILVSELGDKTFIITAIMAMKNSRTLVFLGSAIALLLMTVMSVGMGMAATVIPDRYTHYASIVLFLFFGFKMLMEAYAMEGNGEDFDEVERSLAEDRHEAKKDGVFNSEAAGVDIKVESDCSNEKETGRKLPESNAHPLPTSWYANMKKTISAAPVFIKVFIMILVAEWGDRSQISTVILSAREEIVGVFAGSFIGHVLCSGLAVIGGRFIADIISVRTMTIIGGIIFLFFALVEIISGD